MLSLCGLLAVLSSAPCAAPQAHSLRMKFDEVKEVAPGVFLYAARSASSRAVMRTPSSMPFSFSMA